jgi:hypothetical protein
MEKTFFTHFFYSMLLVVVLGVGGCATSSDSQEESFTILGQGEVEKVEGSGYRYQASEYDDYGTHPSPSPSSTTSSFVSRNGTETNATLSGSAQEATSKATVNLATAEKVALPQPLKTGGKAKAFQLALIRKSEVTVLVNISNRAVLQQNPTNPGYGQVVYQGPLRQTKKNKLFYFTGDEEAQKLKEEVTQRFFHHWKRISEQEISALLEKEDVLLCELEGVYYQLNRPESRQAKSEQSASQQLNSYAHSKRQLLEHLKVALVIPAISSSYGAGTDVFQQPEIPSKYKNR